MKYTILLGLMLILMTGCQEYQQTILSGIQNQNKVPTAPEPTIRDENKIKIATFNIQVFGDSKVENQEVLEILTIVACEFDVMAIQEIRDKEETSIIDYVNNINAVCESDSYKYVTSERLGRSTSKEQYGYIYNTDSISLVSTKQYPDTLDDFEREPFFAQFKAKNYTFTLGNFHIKPEDANTEIESVSKVYDYVGDYFDERNLIFLGDFNADCSYFNENKDTFLKQFYWVVDNDADTTVGASDCTYDRIIITEGVKERYTGEWNTFKFDEILELTIDRTKVSDHYPVWFEVKVN